MKKQVGKNGQDKPHLSGVVLSAVVAIIRCWRWGRTEQSCLCYFPLILSQLPTVFSSETCWPIYSLHAVSNSQWFCLSWTSMCKQVTSTMQFGSEFHWSTTHFVKTFNDLEHPCPLLKCLASCPTETFRSERFKMRVHSRRSLMFFVLSSMLSLVTVTGFLIIVEHRRCQSCHIPSTLLLHCNSQLRS